MADGDDKKIKLVEMGDPIFGQKLPEAGIGGTSGEYVSPPDDPHMAPAASTEEIDHQ